MKGSMAYVTTILLACVQYLHTAWCRQRRKEGWEFGPKNEFWGLLLWFLSQVLEFWTFAKRKMNNSMLKTMSACAKRILLIRDPSPPLSTQVDTAWHHSCDKVDPTFPLHFYIPQAIINWTVARPVNEAILFFGLFESELLTQHINRPFSSCEGGICLGTRWDSIILQLYTLFGAHLDNSVSLSVLSPCSCVS